MKIGREPCARGVEVGARMISGAVPPEPRPKELCKSVGKECYARSGSKSSAARYSDSLLLLLARRRTVRRA